MEQVNFLTKFIISQFICQSGTILIVPVLYQKKRARHAQGKNKNET